MNKMNNALPKIATKIRKNRSMANPFVCEYQPSVCSCNSENEPFVGNKIPNTTFQPGTKRILGFTLVELVVAMAVALILISVAFPSFRTLTQNSRMAAQVNDLIADLSFARSEAIKRRATVSICTSSDGATCSGGNWKDGRIIIDAGAVVLRYREALSASTDTLTTTGPNPIIFDSRGGIPAAVGAFSFTFCDERGASHGKRVVLNPIGQATLERDAPPATCL